MTDAAKRPRCVPGCHVWQWLGFDTPPLAGTPCDCGEANYSAPLPAPTASRSPASAPTKLPTPDKIMDWVREYVQRIDEPGEDVRASSLHAEITTLYEAAMRAQRIPSVVHDDRIGLGEYWVVDPVNDNVIQHIQNLPAPTPSPRPESTTPEQQARELMARMTDDESWLRASTGDVVEVANLYAALAGRGEAASVRVPDRGTTAEQQIADFLRERVGSGDSWERAASRMLDEFFRSQRVASPSDSDADTKRLAVLEDATAIYWRDRGGSIPAGMPIRMFLDGMIRKRSGLHHSSETK